MDNALAPLEQRRPLPSTERPLAAPFSMEIDPPDATTLSWHLLGAGGYLDAWTDPREHDALRAAYFESAQATDHGLCVLRESGRATGMVQATRRPNGAFVLHQLALDPGLRKTSRGGWMGAYWLMRAVLKFVQHRGAHFQIFAESARTLSRATYLDFHHKGWAPGLSDLRLVEVYRATPALESSSWSQDDGVEVATPTDGELARVVEELAHRLAPIDRTLVHGQSWLRVARLGGQAMAGLVLELGPQLNVFGVLNVFTLVWLAPCDRRTRERVASSLLAAAQAHLRSRGVVAALLAHPDRELDEVAARVGFRYVSPGLRWTASTEIVPDFIRHLDEVMMGGAPGGNR